jgi:hypothetical protein
MASITYCKWTFQPRFWFHPQHAELFYKTNAKPNTSREYFIFLLGCGQPPEPKTPKDNGDSMSSVICISSLASKKSIHSQQTPVDLNEIFASPRDA